MRSIGQLFEALAASLTHGFGMTVFGRSLKVIHACDNLEAELAAAFDVFAKEDIAAQPTDTCLFAFEADARAAGFAPDLVFTREADGGDARMIRQADVEGGTALALDRNGLLLLADDGRMVALLDEAYRSPAGRGRPNFFLFSDVIISEIVQRSGRLLVHAGGVGREGRCTLWTGDSGCGKTTRVLTLVSEGGDFYGDDQVVLEQSDQGVWTVLPLWRTVRAGQDTCARIPALSAMADATSEEGKHGFRIDRIFDVNLPPPAPLAAINILIPGSGKPRPLNGAEAMGLLGRNFMHYIRPDQARAAFEALDDIVEQVPVRTVSWESA